MVYFIHRPLTILAGAIHLVLIRTIYMRHFTPENETDLYR